MSKEQELKTHAAHPIYADQNIPPFLFPFSPPHASDPFLVPFLTLGRSHLPNTPHLPLVPLAFPSLFGRCRRGNSTATLVSLAQVPGSGGPLLRPADVADGGRIERVGCVAAAGVDGRRRVEVVDGAGGWAAVGAVVGDLLRDCYVYGVLDC